MTKYFWRITCMRPMIYSCNYTVIFIIFLCLKPPLEVSCSIYPTMHKYIIMHNLYHIYIFTFTFRNEYAISMFITSHILFKEFLPFYNYHSDNYYYFGLSHAHIHWSTTCLYLDLSCTAITFTSRMEQIKWDKLHAFS